ncbi:MAG: response regulator [Lentisphaeria bacterium]|nr:response regulator [Lentisphaeria bacterium]
MKNPLTDSDFIEKVALASPLSIYVFDIKERSNIYSTKTFHDLLGQNAQDLGIIDEHTFSLLLHPDDFSRIDELFSRWDDVEDGTILKTEFRIKHALGHFIWVESSATVYQRDEQGDVHYIVGCIQDITERVEAKVREKMLQEELAQSKRMESLAMMAGGVAHDLNNILSPAMGYADLLLGKLEKDDPKYKQISGIFNSVEQAAALSQDLLMVSRSIKITTMEINIHELIDYYLCSSSFKSLAEDFPNISCKSKYHEKDIIILGSHHHLNQVIMNLVSNAFESISERGEIIIETSVVNKEDKEQLCLSVIDNGPGIKEPTLIFDPFYSTKKLGKRHGTGLGMTVVYNVINSLNGHIDVSSEAGIETRFDIYLAIDQIVEKDVSEPERMKHVLIVDDLLEQRLIAQRMVEMLGYTVDIVKDPYGAIDYVHKNDLDLIILDLVLDEDIDGLDTLREVLKLKPKLPCIIIISGYREEKRLEAINALENTLFLAKPFNLDNLRDALNKLFEQ